MDKEAASREIAKILSQLEKDTGQLVRGISIVSNDVTSYTDTTRVHLQYVNIELERLPGHQWASEG